MQFSYDLGGDTYNSIINNLYDQSSNIIFYLKKVPDYDHHVLKYPMDKLLQDMKIHRDVYDAVILKGIREVVYFISREHSKLNIDGFNVILVDSEEKIRLFCLFMIFYNFDSKSLKKLLVGIDFEFNDKKIALCQISFYPHRVHKYIWIFNPQHLNTVQSTYLIEQLLTSKSIYKIFHGSDSLDIPYLFNELFMRNPSYIYDFVMRLIDTRFLCEYYKIIFKQIEVGCSIYEALLHFGTITVEKYKELGKLYKKIEPIHEIKWDVYKMNEASLEYALYDVIYLRDFYFDILNKVKLEDPIYYSGFSTYIPLFTKYIFLEKWEIMDLLKDIKQEIDPLNNYIIKKDDENITLSTIYCNVINNLEVSDSEFYIRINDLLNINYFKSGLTLLFKKIIYSILTSYFDVYMTKKEIFPTKIKIDDIFVTLKTAKLKKLRKFIKKFYIAAINRIHKLYKIKSKNNDSEE